MSRTGSRALAAACLAVALVQPVRAASGQCPQVLDNRADAQPSGPSTAALDILAVTFGRTSGGTRIVVTVDSLPEAGPRGPEGYTYSVDFEASGARFSAIAFMSGFREDYGLSRFREYEQGNASGRVSERSWPVSGHVDVARDRIAIDIPDGLAPGLARGARLQGFYAMSWLLVDTPAGVGVTASRDEAAGGASRYVVGEAGCPPR